jgi:hypothetical protein
MAWKIAERSARARVAVGAAYAAYFLALFAQFPRAGRLPGNCDTWYAIAFTNLYLNKAKALLGLGHYGRFLYPAPNPFAYGETSIGLALLPMLLRGLGLGEIASYYVFLSLVYAATAFAVYLFTTLYVRSRLAAALAGLVFSSSNFLLSTIDSPHTAFFGIAFLALFRFKRYLVLGRGRDLWWSALLAGAQAYFSSYVFLLLAVATAVLGLADLGEIRKRPAEVRRLVLAAALVAALAAPFFLFYVFGLRDSFNWRPQPSSTASIPRTSSTRCRGTCCTPRATASTTATPWPFSAASAGATPRSRPKTSRSWWAGAPGRVRSLSGSRHAGARSWA